MKKFKVVGICGSPRRHGNTAKLIERVLEGCRKEGMETEFILLDDKKIAPCMACYECLKRGKCVIRDDLNEIREKMMDAHAIVIGSPVFNRDVTAQMKAFFDRIFYDIHHQTFSGKYAVCITTYLITEGCGAKTLRDLTMALGYSIVGNLKVKLLKYEDEVERSKEMEKAFKIGVMLARDVRNEKKYAYQNFIRKFFIYPVLRKIHVLLEKKGYA